MPRLYLRFYLTLLGSLALFAFAVIALWHRAGGPRFFGRIVHGALNPEAPCAIAGVRERRYVERFFDLLERYGSPRLREGLARHRGTVVALLETRLAALVEAA
jgi:hypothetical protein